MENDYCITITHFINPHLFWYKALEVPGESKLHVLTEFEENLLALYKNNSSYNNFFRPEIGDKVAVNFIAWNKFIRAEIVHKADYQQDEFIVWALDYGFPLLTKKEFLRSLPLHLQVDIGCVRRGGIANICPAEQEYDDMEGNLVMVHKDKWVQKTCNMLEKLLGDATSISFIEHYQSEDGHTWGDLIVVNHKGIRIHAQEYLLNTKNSIDMNVIMFKKTCSKLKSTKIACWLSNDRNSKMKFNTIMRNYIEPSNKINGNLIDENAKRKVEDWQKRNENQQIGKVTDMIDVGSELSDINVDSIRFNDSVSVIDKEERNYIEKVGMLMRIKKEKYSTEKSLPPPATPKAFEIDIMVEENRAAQPRHSFISEFCDDSSSILDLPNKNGSVCKEKNHILNPARFTNNDRSDNLIDLESQSSRASSAKIRQKNLLEMRLRVARLQKQMKINTLASNQSGTNNSAITKSKFSESEPCNILEQTSNSSISNKSMKYNINNNQNDPANSTISHSRTSENDQCHLVEQPSTFSTSTSTIGNVKETQSEFFGKNIRIQQLIAMRRKVACKSATKDVGQRSSIKDNSSIKTEQSQHNVDKNTTLLNQPKIVTKTMTQPDTHHVGSISKTSIKENLELSKCGYESFNMVPAGFDITRLASYKDEKNHWHRKKSTRNYYIPHEISSTEELFSNSTIDGRFSSSKSASTKTFKGLSEIASVKSESHSGNLKQSNPQSYSGKEYEIENFDEKGLPTELSISSNSSPIIQKLCKGRQLKSPTSQLEKIDKILMEHNIGKDLGNNNILDLHHDNVNSGLQKSVLPSTLINVSCKNEIVPYTEESNSENCSSPCFSVISNDRNKVCIKEYLNCSSLLDIKRSDNMPIVDGERKIQTKFIDHLVLAHSSIQLVPIENIADVPFLPEIHEELNQMRVNKVYRIQVYSWSHVLRNNSLFVVNPSRSGKTWSYLPSLCSLLCCRRELFKPSYGPVAIILVASLKHVELVRNYCRRLMNSFKAEAPTCVPSYGMRNLIETKIELLNGCGILIATPSSILRLLHENENEPLFDAARLEHIVIDDMDIMISRAQEDFESAYRILFKMTKKSKAKKLSPQLIITSRDWDGRMVKFIRISNQPLLLIGDFLEAAVYGQATLSVKLKSNTEKNKSILNFLKNSLESSPAMDNRTLIICNVDEDVHDIYTFLKGFGYPCLNFYSRSAENEEVIIDEWKKQISSQVLICTDARFCELKIQNVNNLIHYSLPTSWTQFTLRFSALARTYSNYVKLFEHGVLSMASTLKKNSARSMILLDENNNLQLPRLVNFMRKHNQLIQEEILAVSRRVLMRREEERILNILCPQLLEFGECDEALCDHRHELTRLDVIKKGEGIPRAGEIRIHVTKIFSPTYYAVRLLKHKPSNTTKWIETRRSSEALAFNVQLNLHYHDDKNIFLHWPPYINDLCIYHYAENFTRARILEAPTLQHRDANVVQSNLKVTLKLIDIGNIINSVKCNEIFVCDEKFKDFPSQAIDVRLLKVVPFDNERSWDSKGTQQVEKWIMKDIKTNYVVQASIDFSLANTIWVKNIVVMEKLNGIDAFRQVVNLKRSLVKENFGVIYNGDRKHVRDLVEEFDSINFGELGDVTTGDSDNESQNESINLIKCSSSNDEANSSSESSKQIKSVDNRLTVPETTNKEAISANVEIEMSTNQKEDNWDDELVSSKENAGVFDPLQIDALDNSKSEKKETWCQLPLCELVKVEIGDEAENGHWENIFLQMIDNKSTFLFEELQTVIDAHVEKLKSSTEKQKEIFDFEPLHNCIVKYQNNYLRAKVYAVYGESLQQRLYKFFLCDYACFTNAKIEELYKDFLYETTDEIVTLTPYQAVHCTLAGIKWDNFCKKYQVTKPYLYACAVLEADSKNKSNSNFLNLPMQSYEILLYECDNENEFSNALLFNKAIVDNGITMYDEKTKNFLEYVIDIQEKEEEDKLSRTINQQIESKENVSKVYIDEVDNGTDVYGEQTKNLPDCAIDMQKKEDCKLSSTTINLQMESEENMPKAYKDEVLTYEQLLDFIKSNPIDDELNDLIPDVEESAEVISTENNTMISKKKDIQSEEKVNKTEFVDIKLAESESKLPMCDSEMDEEGNCAKSSMSLISTRVSHYSASDLLLTPPPSLKPLHKRPQSTWYQDDYMIFISVYAPDIKDYFLEISSKTIIFTADIHYEKFALILNLLGSIETKSVSHEIRGLNVVIRLKKNVFIKWPRLLQESTKYSWLKYDFNALSSMEYIMPQRILHTILDNELNFGCQQTDNYNSDSDNEREFYQTYNPIQNDDECDPFS